MTKAIDLGELQNAHYKTKALLASSKTLLIQAARKVELAQAAFDKAKGKMLENQIKVDQARTAMLEAARTVANV